MEVNYFDIIISVIVLFLGLKGILNGFFKEIFGLIGIVGGIFVASRLGDNVGIFLNDLIFNFDNNSAVSFTGFIIVLALFWLLMIGVGLMFKQLTQLSGLGPIDKILGFLFGASKFFFIIAVIAHASYNIQALKTVIDDTSLKTSILFPVLVETGSVIMKLDPIDISQDINNTTTSLTNKAEVAAKSVAKDLTENTLKQLQESMPNMEQ